MFGVGRRGIGDGLGFREFPTPGQERKSLREIERLSRADQLARLLKVHLPSLFMRQAHVQNACGEGGWGASFIGTFWIERAR